MDIREMLTEFAKRITTVGNCTRVNKMDWDKLVESINYQIDDLSIDGVETFTSSQLLGDNKSYISACSILLDKLQKFDQSLQLCEIKSVYDIVQILNSSVYYKFNAVNSSTNGFKILLLHHIVTALQSECLMIHHLSQTCRKEQAGERGKVLFQLEKICSDIRISDEYNNEGVDEKVIIDTIISKVTSIIKTSTSSQVRLISQSPSCGLATQKLTPSQEELIKKIESSFVDDFKVRRCMLLKRLDVTIQSFLWGDKVAGKESEITAAIDAQRRYLQENATKYSLSDALSAPLSLLHEHSKKITETSGKKKSLVKTIIIGSVPDRGGRANEMRPKSVNMNPNYSKGNNNNSNNKGNTNYNNRNDRSKKSKY